MTDTKTWREVSASEAASLLGYRFSAHNDQHPVTRFIEGKQLTRAETSSLMCHLSANCCRLNPTTGAVETYLSGVSHADR